MKQWLIISVITVTLTSCKSGGKGDTPTTDSTEKKDSPIVVTTDTTKPAAQVTAVAFPADFKPSKTFNADKADLHESLKVQQLDEKKIAYEIMMENGGCPSFTFRGVAILKEGDAESDSDEKNNGYFVAEYVDDQNSKCGVSIRIGTDTGYTDRAKFYIYDCPSGCKTKQESEPLRSK
jgi:hypothetical protein